MSDNKEIILKEEFDGGLKYALYSNFSKYTEAVLELVDNSVSNRIEGRPLTISILVNPRSFTIIDMGGKGMSLKDLNTFLKWGKIKPREAKDIGAYSQGGKSAMGYLGEEMVLTTSYLGERIQYKIEDDNLHEYKLKHYKVLPTPADLDRGYTQIEIKKLKRNIKEDVLKSLLADTYRPLIENKEIVIKYNGDIIKPISFPLDTEFKKENFLVDDIRGWVGRLAAKSGIKGGMRCYKKGRLIRDREFFSKYDANYKGTLNYLFGEVHLDNVPVNTNKTDFDRDSVEWEGAQNKIFSILKSHIDELLGREIKEPTDEEKERVKNARDIFAELIKRRKKDFDGVIISGIDIGQKQPQHKDKESELEKKISTDIRRKNNPRTPPPKEAIGRRKRLKDFMDWDIRPIDESVRSVVENDGKLLIINNLFSGFKEAKGNILYLLETAALQVALPEKDEKIKPIEYLKDFDDLYGYICDNFEAVKNDLNKKKLKNNKK